MIQFSNDGPIEDAKDAATIIVYRERAELEIFMVKRNARSKFMANAMVFPGGRLEQDDQDSGWSSLVDTSQTIATRMDEDEPDRARTLMVAAIRRRLKNRAFYS